MANGGRISHNHNFSGEDRKTKLSILVYSAFSLVKFKSPLFCFHKSTLDLQLLAIWCAAPLSLPSMTGMHKSRTPELQLHNQDQ